MTAPRPIGRSVADLRLIGGGGSGGRGPSPDLRLVSIAAPSSCMSTPPETFTLTCTRLDGSTITVAEAVRLVFDGTETPDAFTVTLTEVTTPEPNIGTN